MRDLQRSIEFALYSEKFKLRPIDCSENWQSERWYQKKEQPGQYKKPSCREF